MLSGTIDSGKGLLVKQTGHSVAACHLFHGLHRHLIMIHSQVCLLVNRSQLMLCRRCLVVLRLCCHAQLPQLYIQIPHIGADSLPDSPKIMVIQLLSLGRHSPEQSSSCINQILSLEILIPVYHKVFLLRSYRRNNPLGCRISEETKNPKSLLVNGLHGTQKRCLLIQRLATVGAECGGNTESHSAGILSQKCRGGAVPGRISPCLKGCPQSAGGK